jgi:hypothetical protein
MGKKEGRATCDDVQGVPISLAERRYPAFKILSQRNSRPGKEKELRWAVR